MCGSLQDHSLTPPALQTSTFKANFMGNRSNHIAVQISTCRSLASGRQNPDDHKGSLRCRSRSGSNTEQSRRSHRGDRQRHWPHTHEGRPETQFFTFSWSGGVALPCIPVTQGQPIHHVSCDVSSELLFFYLEINRKHGFVSNNVTTRNLDAAFQELFQCKYHCVQNFAADEGPASGTYKLSQG